MCITESLYCIPEINITILQKKIKKEEITYPKFQAMVHTLWVLTMKFPGACPRLTKVEFLKNRPRKSIFSISINSP